MFKYLKLTFIRQFAVFRPSCVLENTFQICLSSFVGVVAGVYSRLFCTALDGISSIVCLSNFPGAIPPGELHTRGPEYLNPLPAHDGVLARV